MKLALLSIMKLSRENQSQSLKPQMNVISFHQGNSRLPECDEFKNNDICRGIPSDVVLSVVRRIIIKHVLIFQAADDFKQLLHICQINGKKS